MKILNLYAGIGGNRKLWRNVEVTAVELNPKIAKIYQDFFPDDRVIIGDAIEYLLKYYKEYSLIWGSPPCPRNSQYRHNVGVLGKGFAPVMPDLTLYEIIIFLKTYYKGLWVIENVKPYYNYLIEPTVILQRHPFWSNFKITDKKFESDNIRTKNKIGDFDDYQFVQRSNIANKRQILRNCVKPEVGEHILNCAMGSIPPVDFGLFADESKLSS